MKRIIVVLKRWLEHYYSDFEGELLNSFRQFVTLCQDAEGQLLKKVLEVVEKKVSKFVNHYFFVQEKCTYFESFFFFFRDIILSFEIFIK
jgi:hypothetical protein